MVLTPIAQISALCVLYNATHGKYWLNAENWCSSQPVNLWFGIQADSSANVVGIDLRSNNLTGTIPTYVGSLNYLTVLQLSHNNLFGTIPASLASVQSLNTLLLSDNSFSGTLPSLSSNVSILAVDNNSLSGTISSNYCSSTTDIIVFSSGNNFDCYEPCISFGNQLSYVDYVGSSEYRVCGSQMSLLCELETALAINLRLTSSHAISEEEPITIEIPNVPLSNAASNISISPLPSLYKLAYVNNFSYFEPNIYQYEITISRDINIGHALIEQSTHCLICNSSTCLSFSGYYDGPISSFDASLQISCTREIIVTSANIASSELFFHKFHFNLKRYFRPSIWECSSLSNEANLNPCSWHGIHCSGQNSIVDGIVLSNYLLNGSIPTSLGSLASLKFLDLSANHIVGTLPSSLGALSHLEKLDLSNNLLTGNIPDSIANLVMLQVLDLGSNSLTGSVPNWFPALKSTIRTINLADNSLKYSVPQSICELTNKTVVNILDNPLLTCLEDCLATSGSDSVIIESHLLYCAPTMFPTVAPAPSSIASQTSLMYKVVGGTLVSVFFVGLFLLWLIRWRRRMKEYAHLPVHKAVIMNAPITEKMLKRYISTVRRKDNKGRTALELVLRRIDNYDISAEVLFLLFGVSFEIDVTTGAIQQDNFCWSKLIQHSQENVCDVVERVLSDYADQVDMLAYSLDEEGRRCIDIASPKCRHLIRMSMYLHRRFELKSGDPEHKSPTSLVKFAIDHKVNADGVDLSTQVALKFMKDKQQFLAEIETRASAGFSSDYVLLVREKFDSDSSEIEAVQFRASAIKKGFASYPYCLVMDVAESNLQTLIMKQRIAGTDWDTIRMIVKSLSMCLNHVHNKMIMHGDLKPMNVVVVNNGVRLIDFDACASFHQDHSDYSGYRYSSAYLPPELFFMNKSGVVSVKSFVKDVSSGKPILTSYDRNTHRLVHLPYSLVKATPSQDMWALGAIIYFLCTGVTLFPASVDDSCSKAEMVKIYNWTDELKEEKLSVVSDGLARNLLSLLLEKDPKRRIDANHVISHPFISGIHPGRLQGESPDFDVFISYRVDSDLLHSELLYDALVSLGLQVWWDKKSLSPGQPWEEGFCNGLINSCCFVCLLSQDAINNPEKPWQNMTNLEVGSRCDNVLMEWRLALELRERHMIDGIFPVFIGNPFDENPNEYSDYFISGCHPEKLPNISVASVEQKLRENLGRQGLGLPLITTQSVKDIVTSIVANQGGFIRGDVEDSIATIAQSIASMRWQLNEKSSKSNASSNRLLHSGNMLSTMDQLFGSHSGLMHSTTSHDGTASELINGESMDYDKLKEDLIQKTTLLQFNASLVTSLERKLIKLEDTVATQLDTIAAQSKEILRCQDVMHHSSTTTMQAPLSPIVPTPSGKKKLQQLSNWRHSLASIHPSTESPSPSTKSATYDTAAADDYHVHFSEDGTVIVDELSDDIAGKGDVVKIKPSLDHDQPVAMNQKHWLWI